MLKNVSENYLNEYLKELYLKLGVKNEAELKKEIFDGVVFGFKVLCKWI